MFKRAILVAVSTAVLLYGECKEYVEYKIATGDKRGTYYKFGQDLAKFVTKDACINLKVLSTKGSLENIMRLSSSSNDKIEFAIVQSDVMDFFLKKAQNGQKIAMDIVDNLRVIMPLYSEEIHLITSADSNIESFKDIKGKNISIGTEGSGIALTSQILYRKLFNEEILERGNFIYSDLNNSLDAIRKGVVDVAIFVGGVPVPKLIKPYSDIDGGVKLAKYLKEEFPNSTITETYPISRIYRDSYPWLDRDIKTLSTKAYLITFSSGDNKRTKEYLKRFILALNSKLKWLKSNAISLSSGPHPKWREVQDICSIKLTTGWKFHNLIEEIRGSRVCQEKRELRDSNTSINSIEKIESPQPSITLKPSIVDKSKKEESINREKVAKEPQRENSSEIISDEDRKHYIDPNRDIKDIVEFVKEFTKALSGNSVEDIVKFYDNQVDIYFNIRDVDRATIAQDIKNTIKSWRYRRYQVDTIKYVKGPYFENGDVYYKISLPMDWRAKSDKDAIKGRSVVFIRLVKRGQKFLIKSITSSIVFTKRE